jgi:hypothetical protein
VNIQCFDNIIPFHDRQDLLEYCANSKFVLGWEDRTIIENEKSIPCIHSNWSQYDFERSCIIPYIHKCIQETPWFTKKFVQKVILNLTKSDDVHYIHAHQDQYVVIYYVNLDWEDGWYGETIFYNPNDLDEVAFTSVYKPGRILLFDGIIPHVIRPQSIKGPKYRMTLTVFFGDKEDELS